MKVIAIIFCLLTVIPLSGMEIVNNKSYLIDAQANKKSLILALEYRMKSRDLIVFHYQKITDDAADTIMLNNAYKAIEAVVPSKGDGNVMINQLDKSIALCVCAPSLGYEWMNVHKYNVLSKQWDYPLAVMCQSAYKDCEGSDFVVLSISDNDQDSIESCCSMVRLLEEKGVPLLVTINHAIREGVWQNLGDLFEEEKEVWTDGSQDSEASDSSDEDIFNSFNTLKRKVEDSNIDNASDTSTEDIFKEQSSANSNDEKIESTIKSNVDNKKPVNYFKSIVHFAKNPWVIGSGISVALFAFIYYYKFVYYAH